LSSSTLKRPCGFTLIEVAIVLLIVTLVLGGLLMPLSAQVEQHNINETQKSMEEMKEALVGYALDKGHLPCPDKVSGPDNGDHDRPNDGFEDFDDVPGTSTTGQCIVQGGNFPWATLGMGDADVWGRRYIYRVTKDFSNRAPATVLSLGAAGTLRVCSTEACLTPRLTDSAAAVIVSRGKNQGNCAAGPSPPNCLDESENTNGNNDFVSRVITSPDAPVGEFDDLVTWLSPYLLFNRMVAAGRLP
jgi:prepilin-type N-terminal cleavage/methylation domain-containing protein